MRIILTTSFVILFLGWLPGQENTNWQECGTEVTPDMVDEIQEMQPAIEAYVRSFIENNQGRVLSHVPVLAHVIRTSSGTGGVSIAEVNTAIDNLNDFYANADLNFFLCGDVNFINNSTYSDFTVGEEGAFMTDYGQDNVLNLIIPNEVYTPQGDNICGFAFFPWQNQGDFAVVEASCFNSGNTVAHEVGHYLGLFHTHSTTNGVELVNGSNCSNTGDLVCDTPADPNLSGQVNTSCQYTGNAVDPNGQAYNPDERNIMAYSRHSCRDRFSNEQYARANFFYNEYRTNLVCPQPCAAPGLYDFVAVEINTTEAVLYCLVEGVAAYVWAIREEGEEDWFYSDAFTSQGVNFTGFNSNTVYEYAVRVDCGNGDLSEWSPVKTFRTAAELNGPVLTMWQEIQVDPLPVERGEAVSFYFNVVNRGLGDFDGNISLDLYDENFDYIEEIDIYQDDLCANCYYTNGIVFNSSIDHPEGTYYVLAWYQHEGGDWLQVNDDVFENAIEIEIVENFTPALTVSPSSVSFGAGADSEDINVSSNVSWTVNEGSSWVFITNGGSGSNNGNFTINATTNTSTSSRSATVTVSGDGITRTISVTQAGQSASLTVSPSSVSFGAGADSESISVSSNISWAVSESSGWLSITGGSSGSNNGNFTINATANSSTNSRSATVTVSGSGITRTINVTQAGQSASLTVSPSSVSFGAGADNESISVSSNVSWTVSESSSWVSITGGSSGSNNGNFTINATTNSSTTSRSTTVTVSGGGVTRMISVTQAGQSASLTVSPSSVSFGAGADNESISVSSNVSWTVSESSSWLSITGGSSGSNNGNFTISAIANNDCSIRSATVMISGGGLSRTVQVTQSGSGASLTLATNTADFLAEGGSESIQLNSDVSWQANSAANWLTVAPPNGTGNATLILTAASNPGNSPRTTTVTVSTGACGGITQTIDVSQEQSEVNIPWVISETGDNHTVIIPNDSPLLIDGEPLAIGDAIGFFYTQEGEEYCSNYLIWTGESTSLPVYGNDADAPAKNGFDNGELLRAKVYRVATEEIFTAQLSFVPVGGHPLVTHTNTYADDAISMLSGLEASSQQSLTISLENGWNMISSYLAPTTPNMLQLLNGIQADVLLLKDAEGNTVIPSFAINNVGDWTLHDGYKVKMSQATELEIIGAPINPGEEDIALMTGWQIIAYLRDSPQDVQLAFDGISDQIEIIKNNSGQNYIPAFNINTLGDLEPTQGYKVKANQNTTLTYNNFTPTTEQRHLTDLTNALEHFLIDSSFNTGSNAIIVFPRENLPEWMSPEDEIAVYNQQGFLAGAVVVEEENFALTVWGDDLNTQEVDGLQTGENYRFVWWQRASDAEAELELTMENGDGLYAEDDLEIVGTIAVVSDTREDIATRYLQVFPNPATRQLNIRSSEGLTQLVIMDASGREVMKERVTADLASWQLDITSLSAGLYWLKVWDGEVWTPTRFIKQ